MVCRILIGNRPGYGMGAWITRPGFDAFTDDFNDRAKFFFSSTWGKTCRICASGYSTTHVGINPNNEPGTIPLLFYRLLTGSFNEKQNLFRNENVTSGSRIESWSETYSIWNGSQFVVNFWRDDPGVTTLRYVCVQV